MNGSELPEDLEQLERDLLSLPQPHPPDLLRARVLQITRSELQGRGRNRRWLYAACAAAIVMWVNISWGAARVTDYGVDLPSQKQTVLALEVQLRLLLPDMGRQDTKRHAVMLRAGMDRVRPPLLPTSPLRWSSLIEHVPRLP